MSDPQGFELEALASLCNEAVKSAVRRLVEANDEELDLSEVLEVLDAHRVHPYPSGVFVHGIALGIACTLEARGLTE